MANVRLLLRVNKLVRGKEYKAGTPVFSGECLAEFKPADIEKGIQLQEISVEVKPEAPAPKPGAPKAGK